MSETFTSIKNLQNCGIQNICVDSSGYNKDHFFVCDAEGIVLKFTQDALLGSSSSTSYEIGDSTSASLAWHNKTICVGYSSIDFINGTDKTYVGKIEDEQFEELKSLIEFQLNTTSVDINADYVVAGSRDFNIKKARITDQSDIKSCELNGEPVCVKIDPKGEFVAVSSTDGILTFLSLESFDTLKTIKSAFPPFETIHTTNSLVRIAWSRDGKRLFVPSRGSVKSFRRDTWEEESTGFKTTDDKLVFSTTCVSRCGKYLAASTMSNDIYVWSIETRKVVKTGKHERIASGENVVVSIEFAPFSDDLIVADSNAGIRLFHVFEKQNMEQEVAEDFILKSAVDENDDDEIVLNRTKRYDNDLFGIENELDENSRFSSASEDIAAIKKKYGYANGEFGMMSDGMKKTTDDYKPQTTFEPMYREPIFETKKVMIPDRFVCSSSPLESCQRYLKYNQYGIVRGYMNDAAKTSGIDIEFHNKSVHADIILDNFERNFQLADISLKVVALASLEKKYKSETKFENLDDENEQKGTSELYVIPISSFDKQRWSLIMPRHDGVVDLLVSESQVVVLTVKRNVRVFSISGIQRHIFTHPGPILTAACFNDRLAIASVAGADFYESHIKKVPQWKFEVHEYSLNIRECQSSNGVVSKFDLPVNGGEQLEWIGYSTKGNLVVMDSSYNVLIRPSAGLWVPIFDGSVIMRSQSDGIFPIATLDGISPEFRYLYCRGTKYPLVSAVNSPITVPWKLPYCQPDNDRTKLEQEFYCKELSICDAMKNGELDAIDKLEKHHLAAIIKLFALAVKSNCDGRAAELAAMVRSSKGVQLLCNYANKNKKVALANKVAEIGCQIMESSDKFTSGAERFEQRKPTVEENEETSMKPRSIANGKRRVLEENKPARSFTKVSTFENEEDDEVEKEDPPSVFENSQQLNESLIVAAVSSETVTKNPFLKSSSSTAMSDSGSILDQLEKQTERKRKNDENFAPPTQKKQRKLAFTSKSEKSEKVTEKKTVAVMEETKNEEETPAKKSVTPYDLWMEEEKSTLRDQFDGEESGFAKFCIQQFRGLSKEDKESWKLKASQINS